MRRPGAAATGVLDGFSLEMTGRDVDALRAARDGIPAGTRVNVTFLAHEDLAARRDAARAAKDLGLLAVPHVSARRLTSRAQLEAFLAALRLDGTNENVFVVAGDPVTPEGPFDDALAVIDSGVLQRYGVRHVGIAGYPQGHPDIPEPVLWSALENKAERLRRHGFQGDVITQLAFDADAVVQWVERVRTRGLDLPIRVGVPGPAGVKRLLAYAGRFGVRTSTGIARKYGFSLTNLMGTAGPDRFLQDLSARYDPARHGDLKVHFFTFGGIAATTTWVRSFRGDAVA